MRSNNHAIVINAIALALYDVSIVVPDIKSLKRTCEHSHKSVGIINRLVEIYLKACYPR